MCEPQPLQEDDILARWIYSPMIAGNIGKIGVLPPMTFEDGRGESVNCLRLFDNPKQDCHRLGVAKRDMDNQIKRQNNKTECSYVGYGTATIEGVLQIRVQEISFLVEHTPKNDNLAHCDIKIVIPENTAEVKSKKRNAKAAINDLFARLVEEHST